MKNMLCLLFIGLALTLNGCASNYIEKENWIDEQDVLSIVKNPTIQAFSKLGSPVVVQMFGDTLEFVYNYRSAMYGSQIYNVRKDDGITLEQRYNKPDDSNRIPGRWGREEEISFLIYKNKVFRIDLTERIKSERMPKPQNESPIQMVACVQPVAYTPSQQPITKNQDNIKKKKSHQFGLVANVGLFNVYGETPLTTMSDIGISNRFGNERFAFVTEVKFGTTVGDSDDRNGDGFTDLLLLEVPLLFNFKIGDRFYGEAGFSIDFQFGTSAPDDYEYDYEVSDHVLQESLVLGFGISVNDKVDIGSRLNIGINSNPNEHPAMQLTIGTSVKLF